MVYLSTFVAVCGSFAFGTGWLFISYSGCHQGRSRSVNSRGGCLAIYFAEGPLPLDLGRLATGFGMGVFSYVVPVFIVEIAPKHLRGALTAANQLLIVTGVAVSFVVGTQVHWRTLAIAGLIPCAVLLVDLFVIPESPRWLAKIRKQKEFDVALRKLRGYEIDVSEEAAEIWDYIETLEKLPKARVWDLFQRRYLQSVIIGVGLMICQQFGGINGICFYTSSIFESAGFPADLGTIIYAILQVSAVEMVLGSLLTLNSVFVLLENYQIGLDAAPSLAITGILLYIAGFSLGMGAVPWVIMSEIFLININGAAGGLVTLVNWVGAWAVSYTFNFLLTWSSYGTFLVYATVNASSIVFVIKLVPETKGKTLEQIQNAINSH